MGSISKTKTWSDNENVTYTDLNGNFDTLYNEFNGSIDNDNIKTAAGITESKVTFNTSSGHNHDGSNSRLIPAIVGVPITGTLVVSSDPAFWIPVRASRTITEVYGIVKTAPAGDEIIVDVEYSTDDGDTWTSIWATNTTNRLTISAGTKDATQTSFDTSSIASGSLLRIAVDQVGSTTAGADLIVTIKM